MKKITLLFTMIMLFAFTWQSMGQSTVYQTFMATGADSDPTVLSIAADDITVLPDGLTADSMTLENFVVHYSSETGTTTYCGNWYDFNLDIDGANAVTNGCDVDINGTDLMGFSSLDITSNDLDAYTDPIYVFVDVAVTFTPTEAPDCTALVSPANGDAYAPTTGDLTWAVAGGQGTSGYNLTVGTTAGGDDVLATTDVGNVLTYNIGALAQGTTYYVSVIPYNSIGDATGCTEESFTTFVPPANDLCADAVALTVGGAIDENVVVTHNMEATDSGETAPGCGNYSGGDVWFTAVVPVTGNITFETIRNDGSSLSDTGAAVYSGDCGALVLVECNDDGSDDGAFSKVALTGQTPGDVLYFRAWEYGNNAFGPFSVVAYDPTPVDYQTECVDGQDQDAFQLVFNAADITVNQGTAISAVLIENFVSHYSTPDGTTTWCPSWYYFTLNVDGADVVVDGCAADINGTNITGFTTATITITDADNYNDHVYLCGDLKVYHEEVLCPMPMDLTATDITVDSANLGWTTDGEEAMWNIEYGEADFVLGEGTLLESVDANPYLLEGLTDDTTYDFYVQAACDPDMSMWVGPFSFTTIATCLVPTDLTATDIIDVSANLGWTAGGDESTWNLEYGEAGFVLGEGTMVAGVDANPYLLEGLTAMTSYEFYVQADCGAGDMSTWAGPFAFVTTENPDLVLVDRPADGTNSIISVDGTEGSQVFCADYFTIDAYTQVGKINVFGTNSNSAELSPLLSGFSVYIYTDAASLPNGDLTTADVISLPNIPMSAVTVIEDANFVGNFAIDLTAANGGINIDLNPGSYWIAVAAVVDDPLGAGRWNWMLSSSVAGVEPVLVDPADLFGVGATSWTNISGVIGASATSMAWQLLTAENIGVADATIDGFGMYPNPVQNTLTINATNSIDIVTVYNLLGQEVLVNTPSATEVQMDMTNLPTGAYVVKVKAGEQTGSYNLIKQ